MARRSRRKSTNLTPTQWLIAGGILAGFFLLNLILTYPVASAIIGVLVVGVAVSVVVITHQRRRETARREREARIHHAQFLGELLAGNGTDFEHTVTDVLNAHGFDVVRVGGANDRGIDVRGHDPEGRPVAIQCKRYGPDNKVSSPQVQSFIGAVFNDHAAHGMLVTTSTFTREARKLAADSRVPIDLIDGQEFVRMAREASEGVPPTVEEESATVPISSSVPMQFASRQRPCGECGAAVGTRDSFCGDCGVAVAS